MVGKGTPMAFSSSQAFSQLFASREDIYTFAPFATKPSEIMRPTPLPPPVTRTTLPLTEKREEISIVDIV